MKKRGSSVRLLSPGPLEALRNGQDCEASETFRPELRRRCRLGLRRNPYHVYIEGLSAGSRPGQRSALKKIAERFGFPSPERFPWHELRHSETVAIRAWLADTYAPTTARKMLSAVKGVLKEAYALELMSRDDKDRALLLKTIEGGPSEDIGRQLTDGELVALFAACDRSALGRRDAALIAVLYGGALRRGEAMGLDVDDIDFDERTAHVRRAKRNRQRLQPLPAGAVLALGAWLERREAAPELEDVEVVPLFVATNPRRQLTARRLSVQSVAVTIARVRRLSSVAMFTAHDLRRTFCSEHWDKGTDGATLQALMGHANMNTTTRYDKRPFRARVKAAERIHVPFVP